jgi:iron complex outermembrane receptor protein
MARLLLPAALFAKQRGTTLKARHHLIALAALTAMAAPALAQTAAAPAPATNTPQRIEVTGSLIKRTDTATPSVVQSFGREEITRSGYTTIEELLRSTGAVDTGSIGDAAASGFVGGLSTISLRGFGSQATLVLINGRRTAPVAAVDINFGRGSLISVNTIPKGAIDRIDVLKDGASAMYGSDAMAGVINYVLRKDYQGAEASVGYTTNDRGRGTTKTADLTFGFGNIDTQRFNVFGGMSYSKRDAVNFSDLVDRGNQAAYDAFLTSTGSLARFTPDSVASFYGNYYRVPNSVTGTTTINGIAVANNSPSGVNFLGSLPGCAPENTVGQGVPNRPAGFAATTASLPTGMCRYNLDNADETIAEQDRFNATVRGTFAISTSLTAYADLMYSQTKTNEQRAAYAMTTGIFSQTSRTSATTWPLLNGTFRSQPAIVLNADHPDNPTRGTANAQPIQLLYRFEDLPRGDINTLKSLRFTTGLEGSLGAWDFDTALLYSRQDNTREQEGRVRASLLTAAINNQTYRFGKPNTPEGIASVSSTATNEGESTITSVDFRASRELFKMSGGMAAVALGVEARRESLTATSDENYFAGDYIGLVANGASGSRTTFAAFGELSMPVLKDLEVQAALRAEKYSDFGDATTGKLGFKWTPMKGMLAFRGTAATGFRAPSISQISDSFSLSFHSFGERRIIDSLRCDPSTNRTIGSPNTNVLVNRDCNVLGFTPVPAGTVNPGNIPTVVGGNPNVKAETSRSFTLGLLLEPTKEIDLGIDMWYFQRDDEIRVQRGADIMDAYNANPSGPAAAQITRDPNQATWLKDSLGNPTATNTGPIILMTRQYGNFKWTKTAGIDYDLNVRLPATDIGKFSVKLQGTYTKRFDRLVLEGAPVDRLVGTSTSDIARTRASLTLNWNAGDFFSFIRHNHTDPISTTTSAACLNSTTPTAAQTQLRAAGRCKVRHERTVDMGVTYDGIKNLSFTGTVFNLMNDYNRSNGIPSAFTYWDPGLNGALGRRFSLSATYKFF